MTTLPNACSLPEPSAPGPIEQEAIDRGEAPEWVATARELDALEGLVAGSTTVIKSVNRQIESIRQEIDGILALLAPPLPGRRRGHLTLVASHRDGKIVGEGEGR